MALSLTQAPSAPHTTARRSRLVRVRLLGGDCGGGGDHAPWIELKGLHGLVELERARGEHLDGGRKEVLFGGRTSRGRPG